MKITYEASKNTVCFGELPIGSVIAPCINGNLFMKIQPKNEFNVINLLTNCLDNISVTSLVIPINCELVIK